MENVLVTTLPDNITNNILASGHTVAEMIVGNRDYVIRKWEEKTGLKKRKELYQNRAMDLGNYCEPRILQAYANHHGAAKGYKYFGNVRIDKDKGGVLDGVYCKFDKDGNIIEAPQNTTLEIKTATTKGRWEALSKKADKEYELQLAWYVYITGFAKGVLIIFNGSQSPDREQLKFEFNDENYRVYKMTNKKAKSLIEPFIEKIDLFIKSIKDKKLYLYSYSPEFEETNKPILDAYARKLEELKIAKDNAQAAANTVKGIEEELNHLDSQFNDLLVANNIELLATPGFMIKQVEMADSFDTTAFKKAYADEAKKCIETTKKFNSKKVQELYPDLYGEFISKKPKKGRLIKVRATE